LIVVQEDSPVGFEEGLSEQPITRPLRKVAITM
jgi:hypothetical protein